MRKFGMKSALPSLGEGAWLLGPLAVCGSTILLVVHATSLPFSPAGAGLFCDGVIAAYALDHWADAPVTQRSSALLWLAALAAASGALAACSLPSWKFCLAAGLGLVGLSYRQLKKWPMSKTVLVAGTWTVAGVSFPVEWSVHHLFLIPFGGALLALFAAGALLCDFKDGAADSQAGVRTLVVLGGPGVAAGVAGLLALGGVLAALSAGRPGLVAAGLALAALAASPRLVSRPVLGPALVDGALTLPAVLILLGLA
jgi:hypothetical protein